MSLLVRRPWGRVALLALAFAVPGCRDAPPAESPAELAASAEAPAPPPAVADDERPRVLFLGTSLTAGLGLSEEEAYPARLAALLEERGLQIVAINAGVSGDTSSGGLSRLDWLLRTPPEVILIELGANDGLRGLPADMTEANLREVIAKARAVEARVIVAGMMMPPNYGEDYAREFASVFPRVAGETGSLLVPFLLEGVAAEPELNLADGMHPNVAGHERIARTLLPVLIEALDPTESPYSETP